MVHRSTVARFSTSAAAVRWLRAQGVDMARLAIGGDSAGGGLTLATLLSLRDTGAPLLIHVSATETLFDDATRVADKARAAGVSVTYREWRDVPHVWQLFHPMLPEARESLADIARFVVERTSAAIFPPCESGHVSAR